MTNNTFAEEEEEPANVSLRYTDGFKNGVFKLHKQRVNHNVAWISLITL